MRLVYISDSKISFAAALGFTPYFAPSTPKESKHRISPAMSIASHTFGLPLQRRIRHGGSFTSIGARIWLHLIARIKANMAAAGERRAERELLALAETYEHSMPSFAAELRAANARRD